MLLIVSEKGVDQKAIQPKADFLVQTLPAVGWKGWRIDYIFRFVVGMIKSMIQSYRIFRIFPPDVVVGMGGFSSVAPLFMARLRGIPSCIHESNVIAGKANRLLAYFASTVAVGFEATRNQFSKDNIVWTGTPVRSALRNRKDSREARETLGLAGQKPTVLVIGGSQGAKSLNRLVVEAASQISLLDIQWLHLTGVEDESNIRSAYASAGKMAQVRAFCHEMEVYYAAADLVIARSGASSLAEIALWSLPSILIPYLFAADKHQLANAKQFVKVGAAMILEEEDGTAEKLAAAIQSVLMDQDRRRNMAEATMKLRCDHAHQSFADMIEKLGTVSRK